MNSSARLTFCLPLALTAAAVVVACDGADAPMSGPTSLDAGVAEALPGNQTLRFTKDRLYSAFVEGHPAVIPVTLKMPESRGKDAKFKSSDTKIAVVQNVDDGALVTVKKEGHVLITGSLAGDTGTLELDITKYSEAQWLAGEKRYTKSVPAVVALDGGALGPTAVVDQSTRNPDGACLTCHSQKAATLRIEDTPVQTSGFSDDELIAIVAMGKQPESWLNRLPANEVWGVSHTWNVTEDEKHGLVAYLRTKPPQAMVEGIGIGVRPCSEAISLAGLPGCNDSGQQASPPSPDGGIDAAAPPPADAGSAPLSDAGV